MPLALLHEIPGKSSNIPSTMIASELFMSKALSYSRRGLQDMGKKYGPVTARGKKTRAKWPRCQGFFTIPRFDTPCCPLSLALCHSYILARCPIIFVVLIVHSLSFFHSIVLKVSQVASQLVLYQVPDKSCLPIQLTP